MKCPYCFKTSSIKYNLRKGSRLVNFCTYCKSEIPRSFYESPEIQYTKIGMIGHSGHGKTTYSISLLYILKSMHAYWKGFYMETMDDNSHEALHFDVNDLEQGMPLAITPAIFPHPVLLRLNNIPGFSKHFTGLFDTGGRLFENLELMTKKGRYFTHSNVVFFFISLIEEDMKDNWNLRTMKLLDRYINVIYSRYGVKTEKKQSIVFILTKADELQKLEVEQKLPEELLSILQNGTLDQYSNPDKNLIDRIKENSDSIEKWLRQNDCNSFINFARNHFRNVCFVLTSALGNSPSDDKVVKKFSPRDPKCILDPLLWSLHLSSLS